MPVYKHRLSELVRIAAGAQASDLSALWKVLLKCLLLMEPLTGSLC